jgi:hypothetical protein
MKDINWTSHAEWVVLLGAVLTSIFLFIGRMDRMEDKIQHQITDQSQRSDRLYEMFIDLLKDRK